jgi:hypothetical protein
MMRRKARCVLAIRCSTLSWSGKAKTKWPAKAQCPDCAAVNLMPVR